MTNISTVLAIQNWVNTLYGQLAPLPAVCVCLYRKFVLAYQVALVV